MAWLPYGLLAQAGLLGWAWNSGDASTAALPLSLATALTLYLLWWVSRHKHAILDTPTSRVASAAKGFVELSGQAEAGAAGALRSKLTGLPCLWFEYCVDQRRDKGWIRIAQDRSDVRFRLRDESGACEIDPRGAEIQPRRTDRWTKGDYRFTESMLVAGDTIYALGTLVPEGGAAHVPAQRDLQSQVLSEWKRDQHTLLARFDLNGDGHLDQQEWTLARSAARRETDARMQAQQSTRAELVLRKPEDGRPFLIAGGSPENLARRYVRWFRIESGMLLIVGVAWALWLHQIGVQ